MRKLLFAALSAIVIICISCSENKGGLSATAQKNLNAFKGIVKCFETKDFSYVGDYIAEDAVDHAGPEGDINGLSNIKAMFEKWAMTTENDKDEMKVGLANDEYVMAWMHFTGKAKVDQPDMNLKAGESYDMEAIEVARMKDGKVVEHWTFMSPAEMMKMMGGSQSMPVMDTTNMMKN